MYRAYLNWIDAQGITRLLWYSYVDGPISTSFQGALQQCANPIPSSIVYGPLLPWTGGPPSLSPYLNVTDSAVLRYQTTAGTVIGLTIPGYKESLYLADNQTVDAAQPDVIALNLYAVNYLVDAGGNPAINFLGGLRQKRNY